MEGLNLSATLSFAWVCVYVFVVAINDMAVYM